MIKIGPSLLAADFTRLKDEIIKIEEGGADYLHLDIMDGHFVPNISYGPDIVSRIREISSLYFDVHLMISHPDDYLQIFKDAGANLITVHQETCPHLHRTIERIKELGLHAGVAINPATPISTLEDILPFVDLVLVMSVNPGFGGQHFLPLAVDKVARLKKWIVEKGYDAVIQVDGGINMENAGLVAQAGATYLVAGSAIFKASDAKEAMQGIRQAAEKLSIDLD